MLLADPEDHRRRWVENIRQMSDDFGQDAARLEDDVAAEFHEYGLASLLNHVRLCGAIPEGFGRNSTEEKLYSKYTDVVIHISYTSLGLASIVLPGRADMADVECLCDDYSFVADAKAFRLSRTAKNQKDFKVQAMDTWKHGKPYAMLVCPVYQLPSRSSQIYQQAAARSVCVFTYTHLAVLIRYAADARLDMARALLLDLFRAVEAMNPSKDATDYWSVLNRLLLAADPCVTQIWKEEKIALLESLRIAKAEAAIVLAEERERVMRLSHSDAIREILVQRRLESRLKAIHSVGDNGLMSLH